MSHIPLLKSAYFNLIMGGIGIIFCLMIPILSGCYSCYFKKYDDSKLSESLQSVEVRISGVALLVSACPMILDSLLDLVNGMLLSRKSISCWISRVVIAIAYFMVGIQVTLQYDYFRISSSYALSFVFGIWCVRTVLMTSSLFCLNIINDSIFTWNQTASLSFFGVFVSVFRFYGTTSESHAFEIVACVLPYLFIVVALGFLFSWMYKLWKLRDNLGIDDLSCVYFLFVLILSMVAIFGNNIFAWIQGVSNYSILNASTDNIVFQMYILTTSAIIMSVIPGRIAKMEAVVFKDHVIETKEAYVRYISHELRTPLNTVYMGLQLSTDQIPADTINPIEQERRSTLQEICYACEIALDILNDLLLYDKLQHGLVSLTTEKVLVLDFLSKCINMFTVQLRSKKLHLIFYGSRQRSVKTQPIESVLIEKTGMLFPDHSPLSSEDCIDADKSKLGQVERNLISNAIKFTPDGGDIQVSIDFIPSATLDISTLDTRSLSDNYVGIMKQFNRIFKKKSSNSSRAATSTNSNNNKSPSPRVRAIEGSRLSQSLHESTTTIVKPDIECGCFEYEESPQLVASAKSDCVSNHIDSVDRRNIHKLEQKVLIRGMLVVEVKDSGAGICLEDQERLFKEIVQFKPEELQGGGGSGLGLFITKGIVDLHGGKISVHSEGEGKGTMFRVEIPMKRLCTTTLTNGYPKSAVIDKLNSNDSIIKRVIGKSNMVVDGTDISHTLNLLLNAKNILGEWNFKSVALSDDVLLSPVSYPSLQNIQLLNYKSLTLMPCVPVITNETVGESKNDSKESNEVNRSKKRVLFSPLTFIENNYFENIISSSENIKIDQLVDLSPISPHFRPTGVVSSSSLDSFETSSVEKPKQPQRSKSERNLQDCEIQLAVESEIRLSKQTCNKGLNLLIVDDSKLNRKMMRKLLEGQGHVCEEAEDGLIGVNMVKAKKELAMNDDDDVSQQQHLAQLANNFYYDAILMDFVMPVMNGPTSTAEIRKLGYKGPIIGVTGNALTKDKDALMAAGATHVFIKPLDVSLITKALQGKF